MAMLTDFGPAKPSIQPYLSGYSVPVGLQKKERPGIEEGRNEESWYGYLLLLPFLSGIEFDEAIKQLPEGDYSAERLEVMQERVRRLRKDHYPPVEEYVYAMAQGDQAAVDAFTAKVQAVDEAHPMPAA